MCVASMTLFANASASDSAARAVIGNATSNDAQIKRTKLERGSSGRIRMGFMYVSDECDMQRAALRAVLSYTFFNGFPPTNGCSDVTIPQHSQPAERRKATLFNVRDDRAERFQ